MTFMKPTAGNLDGVPPAASLDAEVRRAYAVLETARKRVMLAVRAFGYSDTDLEWRLSAAVRRVRYLEGLADA